MSEATKSQFWSDFDGTAVEDLNNKNPLHWRRNVLKTRLKGLAGYVEFLQGIQHQGVEVAGIVSRRPDIAIRRNATARSIAELGLGDFFRHPEQIVLTGSEQGKADHVVKQSRDVNIGIIDDKPHRIGPALLGALLRESDKSNGNHKLSLGVVNHEHSWEQTVSFLNDVDESSLEVSISEKLGSYATLTSQSDFRFRFTIVQLDPYSLESGKSFAEHINNL